MNQAGRSQFLSFEQRWGTSCMEAIVPLQMDLERDKVENPKAYQAAICEVAKERLRRRGMIS